MLYFSLTSISLTSFGFKIVKQEFKNNWYDAMTYYAARTLCDAVYVITCGTPMATLTYLLFDMPHELWRFLMFNILFVAMTLIAQSYIMTFATLLADSPMSVVFLAPCTLIPMTLPTGFFVRVSQMRDWIVAVSSLGHMQYIYGGEVIVLYGFDRCGIDFEEKFFMVKNILKNFLFGMKQAIGNSGSFQKVSGKDMKEFGGFANSVSGVLFNRFVAPDGVKRSAVMNSYDLQDDDLSVFVFYIIVFYVLARIAAAFVIVRRLNERM